MAIITSTKLIQSYILTTARYKFSVPQKRILYRLIEHFQNITNGVDIRSDKVITQKTLFDEHLLMTMPISLFLEKDDSKNHAEVKKAMKELELKSFEYEDDETWELIRLIIQPKFFKNTGIVTFTLDRKIIDCLVDFSKGYRKIELQTVFQFDNVNTMRFYELLSNQSSPLTFKIEDLKLFLGLENKYKDTRDFFKFVVDVAKKQLDEKSPFSFTYQKNTLGRKIISITFFPYLISKEIIEKTETNKLEKHISISWDIPKPILIYLRNEYFFDDFEIKNNIEIFREAILKNKDYLLFISDLRVKASKARNQKGYLISSTKKMLKALEEKQALKQHNPAKNAMNNIANKLTFNEPNLTQNDLINMAKKLTSK